MSLLYPSESPYLGLNFDTRLRLSPAYSPIVNADTRNSICRVWICSLCSLVAHLASHSSVWGSKWSICRYSRSCRYIQDGRTRSGIWSFLRRKSISWLNFYTKAEPLPNNRLSCLAWLWLQRLLVFPLITGHGGPPSSSFFGQPHWHFC